MTKYLLKINGDEESSFYGFESEKSKEETVKEFEKVFIKSANLSHFQFYRHKVTKYYYLRYEILTLDEFWEEAIKK